MKKRNLLSLLLLVGLISSCGVTDKDSVSYEEPPKGHTSSSESSSEDHSGHDHSGESGEEGSSSQGGSGSVDPCAAGHELTHYAKTDPTCTESGNKEMWYCTQCEEIFLELPKGDVSEGDPTLLPKDEHATYYLAATGHTYGDWGTVSDPDCDHMGRDERECSVCGHIDVRNTSSLGHEWGPVHYEWVDDTHYKAYRECTRNGCYESETVGVTASTANATCTTAGKIVYTAKQFKATYFRETTPATNEVNLSPLGHNMVSFAASAPSCTTAGRVAHYHCNRCGKNYVDQAGTTEITTSVVIEPLGHDFVTHNQIDATCTVDGSKAYKECTHCNRKFDVTTEQEILNENTLVIEATGHTYGTPTYIWSAIDNDHPDLVTVTGRATCSTCGHVLEETVGTTHEGTTSVTYTAMDFVDNPTIFAPEEPITKTVDTAHVHHYTTNVVPPTCNTAGYTEHICDAEGHTDACNYVDTPTSALGHSYDFEHATYEWSSDNSQVTATAVCTRDGCTNSTPGHTLTQVVNTTNTITTQPTCEDVGARTYTANFGDSGFTNQQKVVELSAIGHNWSAVSYTWNTDNTKLTATRVCINDSNHIETETVDVNSDVITSPSCTGEGVRRYSSEDFVNTAFTAQSKDVAIPALGHTWGDPTYNYHEEPNANSEGTHWETTARRECSVCHEVEEETNIATSIVTLQPTCETEGETTYTTTFENPAFVTQTGTYPDIPALGHSYTVFKEFRWIIEDDVVTGVKAVYSCAHDAAHTTEFNAQLTSEVTVEPTCTTKGTTRYTASYDNHEATLDKQNVPVVDSAHSYGTWVGTKAPTCTEAGVETRYCEYDNEHTETRPVSALGHSWGEVSYVWALDNSSVTATRVCANDSKHVESETVEPGYVVVTPATSEQPGVGRYTAEFTNEAFATQTKNIEIEYEHTHSYSTNVVPPTCTEQGYTLHYCACGDSYKDTYVPAIGHDWGDPIYIWNADNSQVTATRVCANDGDHVESETVSTGCVTVPATCTTAGSNTFTSAAFSNEAFEIQEKVVVLDALGHSWGKPTYDWDIDHGTITATRVCTNDGEHVESETVGFTSLITTQPKCTVEGVRTYTSNAFTNPAFEVQSTTREEPALGHLYGNYTYTWADDYSYVTAHATCTRGDCGHEITEVSTAVTSEVTTAPTCTETGIRTYTVTFTNPNFSTKTKDVKIAALEHKWGEWEQTTAPTCTSTGTLTRVCEHDSTHTETQTIPVVADAHGWVGPQYYWDGNNAKQGTVCEYDNNHKKDETVLYTTTGIYGDSVSGTLSSLGTITNESDHGADDYKDEYGDLNLFFSNTKSSKNFEVEMNLDYVHGSTLDETDDGLIVKIGNGFHYATWSWGQYHSGKSYLLFKSNDTTSGTNSTKKMSYTTPTDNRADYTSVIPQGKTFDDEFRVFASDAHIVIKFKYTYNGSSKYCTLECTITYYTNVKGYEKYFGYTQTFNGRIGSDEYDWNEVNALRVYRTDADATINVEKIKYYGPLDDNSKVNQKIHKGTSIESHSNLSDSVVEVSPSPFLSI